MKLKALQEKRNALMKQGREILDKVTTELRAFTPEEETQLAGIEGEVGGLNKVIDAEMRSFAEAAKLPPILTPGEQLSLIHI